MTGSWEDWTVTLLSLSFPAKRKRGFSPKAMTGISGGKPILFQSHHSACSTKSFLSDASSRLLSKTAPKFLDDLTARNGFLKISLSFLPAFFPSFLSFKKKKISIFFFG